MNSLLVCMIAFLIYQVISRLFRRFGHKGYVDFRMRMAISVFLKWLFIAIALLLSLEYYGVSVGTLWAALSGVLALIALGFVAVWSVLSNILCSILLIFFPPFRIGDEIEIQEPTAYVTIRGKVIGINMFYTTLDAGKDEDDDDNVTIKVPNNIFFLKFIRRIPGKRTESLQKYVARHQED